MVRVALWIDADTELSCGYVSLPGREFVAAGSSSSMLTLAIEEQLRSMLPAFLSFEVAYLHLGCLGRPVQPSLLRRRLAEASLVE